MGKPIKNKKNKVPKITEEQYAAYLTFLKGEEQPKSEGEQTVKDEVKPLSQ